MKRHVLIANVFCALALAACGAKHDAKQVSAEAPQPIGVASAAVVSREVPADLEVTATFRAEGEPDTPPPVAGRVNSTPVDVGDFVRQGQVICELDHRDAQLKLEQARAQL